MRLWGASVSSCHHRGYSGERSLLGRAKGGPENGGLHRDGKWGVVDQQNWMDVGPIFSRKTPFLFQQWKENQGVSGSGVMQESRREVSDNMMWYDPG